MNKETLYQLTRLGAIIPWALFAVPFDNPTASFSLLLFQFMCVDLMLRYQRNN
jgi:hypothetical protein